MLVKGFEILYLDENPLHGDSSIRIVTLTEKKQLFHDKSADGVCDISDY